jgi:anti-anti-sigma factor
MGADFSARPPAFEATVTREAVTVVLRGEFDVTSEGFLRSRLEPIRASRPRRLVFELTQVDFMDCASARLIGDTGTWLPAGAKPVIRRPSPIVRRILEVSGIDALCAFESSAPDD